jgi:cytoskeletal protein CcmA (bactofilin family)
MTIFNRGGDKPADTVKPAVTPAPTTPAASPSPTTTSIVSEPPRAQAQAQPNSPQAPKTGVPMASVISKALKITGQLESTEDIQIDGEIDGDVRGVGVKIGNNAKVKGTVYGDEVELSGTIEGKIEAKKVILTGTARMSGDVSHQDIRIESGAFIDGTLKPDFGKAAVSKPAVAPFKPIASVQSVSEKSA